MDRYGQPSEGNGCPYRSIPVKKVANFDKINQLKAINCPYRSHTGPIPVVNDCEIQSLRNSIIAHTGSENPYRSKYRKRPKNTDPGILPRPYREVTPVWAAKIPAPYRRFLFCYRQIHTGPNKPVLAIIASYRHDTGSIPVFGVFHTGNRPANTGFIPGRPEWDFFGSPLSRPQQFPPPQGH